MSWSIYSIASYEQVLVRYFNKGVDILKQEGDEVHTVVSYLTDNFGQKYTGYPDTRSE